MLWKWTIIVTLAVIAYVAWQSSTGLIRGRQLANVAISHFHDQLNGANYSEIYSGTDDAFRSSGSQEELLKFFEAVHRKLGAAGSSSLVNIKVMVMPNGTFITSVYNTRFELGQATETFNWIKKGDTLILHGYNINSKALIVN